VHSNKFITKRVENKFRQLMNWGTVNRKVNTAWKDRIKRGYLYQPGCGWIKRYGDNVLVQVIQRSKYMKQLKKIQDEHPYIEEKHWGTK
jgi:hypothetical protein